MRGKYFYKKIMKRKIVKIEEINGKWYAYTFFPCLSYGAFKPIPISEKFAKYYFARSL